jgi:hypothetical protein
VKNALIIIWCCVVLLLVSGAVLAVSPFYVDGGLLNWFSPAGENWIGYLLNFAFSILLGLILIGAGGALAMTTGIAASIIAVSRSKPASTAANPEPQPKSVQE